MRGGDGLGVKIMLSNDIVCHAHSLPPSHNIRAIIAKERFIVRRAALQSVMKYCTLNVKTMIREASITKYNNLQWKIAQTYET